MKARRLSRRWRCVYMFFAAYAVTSAGVVASTSIWLGLLLLGVYGFEVVQLLCERQTLLERQFLGAEGES